MMLRFHLWPLVLLVTTTTRCLGEVPRLLLVSFDGFRWDYLAMAKADGRGTPNFDRIADTGVQAPWVKNAYVTVTLPNHYTIVTGLYPENHGVVENFMYDPLLGKEFIHSPHQMADPLWWNNGSDQWTGEPIWITNQRAGDSGGGVRRSGVYFWMGGEAPTRGEHAYHYLQYNESTPFERRADTVVEWFADGAHPINLGLLYISEPDATGHKFGPQSKEILDKVVELDGVLGHLLEGFRQKGLLDGLNIIVTSDHGMEEIQDTVYLDRYTNQDDYKAYGGSTMWNILPGEGKEDEVYEALTKVPGVDVYRKEDIPEEYHYRHNSRILPIIVQARPGVAVCKSPADCHNNTGGHGYNNSLPSMHPFFIARGPAFKEGCTSKPFNNVDIYPLMCQVLQVTPAPHDGSLENIRHILTDLAKGATVVHPTVGDDNPGQTLLTIMLAAGFCALVAGGFVLAACQSHRLPIWRQNKKQTTRSRDSEPLMPMSHSTMLNGSDEEELV